MCAPVLCACALPETSLRGPGALSERVEREGVAPAGRPGGACARPLPRPPAPPARLRGVKAVALGAGTRQAARSAKPEPDATAAAAATAVTCAAVIQGKAARRRQPYLPGLRTECVLRLPAAEPREGCWGRVRRGGPREARETWLLAPPHDLA